MSWVNREGYRFLFLYYWFRGMVPLWKTVIHWTCDYQIVWRIPHWQHCRTVYMPVAALHLVESPLGNFGAEHTLVASGTVSWILWLRSGRWPRARESRYLLWHEYQRGAIGISVSKYQDDSFVPPAILIWLLPQRTTDFAWLVSSIHL